MYCVKSFIVKVSVRARIWICLFQQIDHLLNPGGTFFFSKPPVMLSGREFREKVALAEEAEFLQAEQGFWFVNRMAVLMMG